MEQPIRKRMAELRLVCAREIPILQERANNAVVFFRELLQPVKLIAEKSSQSKMKLGQLKVCLRQLEDDLVRALSVKNRKEAKHMAITDSIRAAKDNMEELKRIAQDQKVMRYQYAAIIYQQLKALEMDTNQGIRHKEHIQDAISWYNKFLGFRVEGGHGVKFIFNNINSQNPNEEYSFTLRHADDNYTLLDCDPYLGDMKELIQELNQTNGLFKFVRIMRENFQATTLKGAISEDISMFPDTSTVSTAAPAASISCDGSDSSEMDKEVQVQLGELQKSPRKVNHGRVGKSAILTPVSALSHRRSALFKVSR
ncbi:hypothetical protein GIB67_004363 [Kingdonia uniflora]|uniref:Kinetochore protein SPC25 n=1 Tax=Kingdonia uniflora TaxID=39325 RepID=A0A7J7MR89_9MAGN|nr:hypothetical protein GIB67_004363 [Kingdonia uniflora]